MQNMIILEPAYRNTYKQKAEAMQDWEGGKDFKICNGTYCSISDIKELKRDYDRIVIMYNIEKKGIVIQNRKPLNNINIMI